MLSYLQFFMDITLLVNASKNIKGRTNTFITPFILKRRDREEKKPVGNSQREGRREGGGITQSDIAGLGFEPKEWDSLPDTSLCLLSLVIPVTLPLYITLYVPWIDLGIAVKMPILVEWDVMVHTKLVQSPLVCHSLIATQTHTHTYP